MPLVHLQRLRGATLANPAKQYTLAPKISSLVGVGGLLAVFNPGQTPVATSPLFIKALGHSNRAWVSKSTGASPTKTSLSGRDFYDFNGVNQAIYFQDPNTAAAADIMPSGGASYTVFVVFRVDNLSTAQGLFGSVTGANSESRLEVTPSGALGGFHGSGAGNPVTAIGAVTSRRVHVGALSYSSTADELDVYLDGARGTKTQSSPSTLDNLTAQIGNWAATGVTSRHMDGKIAEVAIYDWAAQDSENDRRRVFSVLAELHGVTLAV